MQHKTGNRLKNQKKKQKCENRDNSVDTEFTVVRARGDLIDDLRCIVRTTISSRLNIVTGYVVYLYMYVYCIYIHINKIISIIMRLDKRQFLLSSLCVLIRLRYFCQIN